MTVTLSANTILSTFVAEIAGNLTENDQRGFSMNFAQLKISENRKKS